MLSFTQVLFFLLAIFLVLLTVCACSKIITKQRPIPSAPPMPPVTDLIIELLDGDSNRVKNFSDNVKIIEQSRDKEVYDFESADPKDKFDIYVTYKNDDEDVDVQKWPAPKIKTINGKRVIFIDRADKDTKMTKGTIIVESVIENNKTELTTYTLGTNLYRPT